MSSLGWVRDGDYAVRSTDAPYWISAAKSGDSMSYIAAHKHGRAAVIMQVIRDVPVSDVAAKRRALSELKALCAADWARRKSTRR